MQHEFWLSDGSKVEVKEDSVRHIAGDGTVLYSRDCERTSAISSEEKKKMLDSYFFLIGSKEIKQVHEWVNEVKPETEVQKQFVKRVKFGLSNIPIAFKIATMEPSLTKTGEIFYKPDCRVGRGISYSAWEASARRFYRDAWWSSDLASPEEGDIFTAYRVACGMWSLEYVCDDSSSAGNYWDSPKSNHNFEPTGVRCVGGFPDGVGNTLKIFKDDTAFVVFGGDYIDSGVKHPVASVNSVSYNRADVNYRGTGVVVIRQSLFPQGF